MKTAQHNPSEYQEPQFKDVSASDTTANSNPSATPRLFSNVWIIAESERTCNYLSQQLSEVGIRCAAQFEAKTIVNKASSIVTQMHAQRPDFIYVASLHHDPLRTIDQQIQIAARLIIAEQHRLGGQYLVENVNSKDECRGIYLSDSWQASNHSGVLRPLWWCALGMEKAKQVSKWQLSDCSNTTVFTTLAIPISISSCCRNSKFTGRSILPSRPPKAYFAAMTSMIQQVNAAPPVPDSVYAKVARKAKPKPPAPTEDETPGDHTDVAEELVKHGTHAGFEETYDDCGDDCSTIADDGPGSQSYQCFHCDSDEDDESEEHHSWVFATMELANRALGHNQVYSGQHDVCEIFGGDAGTTRVCVKRGLKAGHSFDINIGVDLTKPEEVKHLYQYLERHKPKVIVAGPPCTSFGAWSRYNRIHAYDTWYLNRLIGEKLANLTADLCWYQLERGRHFIVENPAQSDMWLLRKFQQLLKDPRVVLATLDQCEMGLVDPDGVSTRKTTKFMASAESLVSRLRKRCMGLHRHALLEGSTQGISRCRFAQVWPKKLTENLAQGIIETLSSTQVYVGKSLAEEWNDEGADMTAEPVPPVPPATDKPISCPGCRSHARRNDPRHTRVSGNCRFPADSAQVWSCPACIAHRPSTHNSHAHDDTCQWTFASNRSRGSRDLKDPKLKAHRAPKVAKVDDAVVMPPAPDGLVWTPLTDVELISILDHSPTDGWRKAFEGGIMLVQSNGRSLRTCEPKFDAQIYKFRSSFGLFSDNQHESGNWWRLADQIEWTEPWISSSCACSTFRARQRCAPTENNTRCC